MRERIIYAYNLLDILLFLLDNFYVIYVRIYFYIILFSKITTKINTRIIDIAF